MNPDRRVIATRIRWARTPRERARGLLVHPPLDAGEALILAGARQVHTIGLRVPIDVVFCDAHWRVLHIEFAMRPSRVGRFVWRARYVVELPAGSGAGLAVGDSLGVRDGSLVKWEVRPSP